MGVQLLPFVVVVLFIAVVLAGVIKLKIYKVESFKYYVLAPFLPLLVLGFNVWALMRSEDEDLINISPFVKLYWAVRLTFARLPQYMGFFCRIIKGVEIVNKRYRHYELKTQAELYGEAAVNDYKLSLA